MIAATTFRGRRVALFGLGGSGLATAQALLAGGAVVSAWDDSADMRAKALAKNIPLEDLGQANWSQFASLVLAPGVPLTHPQPHWTVLRAQAAGVEIIGDIEVFCRERAALAPDAPFVAITGTNGKSTTTALIAHLYRSLGFDAQMGGNIGTPILSLAPFAPNQVYIIEVSTFQIDLTPSLNPSIGVLLNLTPDHLDRHGTMAQYAAIKERVIASAARAVVAIDDDFTRQIAQRRRARHKPLIAVSTSRPMMDKGFFANDGKIFEFSHGSPHELLNLRSIGSLRGAHNWQNALAAFASLPETADPEQVQRAFNSFPGLAHRMEEVGRWGDILFINDSKATNADAAEKALGAFHNIYWIAGGKPKEGGIEALRPLFSRIAKTYLIGEAAHDFARALSASPHELCGDLDTALARAFADAREKREPAVILLSPACASYDQFKNFEARGDHFRTAVAALVAGEKRSSSSGRQAIATD